MRFVISALLLSIGCAHQGWQSTSREMCSGSVCYGVGDLGGGWRLVHQEDAEVGFFHRASGAIIQSNATCRDDGDATPLATLTGHLLLGYTERTIRSESVVAIAEREALHTVVAARLDGVPVILDLYVFKRNGCIFDLSLAATPAHFSSAAPAFDRFVKGFTAASRS